MPTTPDRRTSGAAHPAPGVSGVHLLHGRKGRLRRAAMVAGAAFTASLLVLTGCSGAAQDPRVTGSSPAASGSAQDGTPGAGITVPTAEPTGTATAGPTGQAAAVSGLRTKVTDVLGRLAAGAPKPSTAQVRDALTGAGIDTRSLEVSESTTPTGLAADSIEAAVLQGKDCVIGQVREGAVTVTVMPVLASGKCFVGS
ncbi:DUF6993 domain-containing protein [Pseudarthrobacter sp. NPDC058362]|uniref:DUF6993 domain-containing protein n=1 Tax=Pseudarthrobacter sp. NPDC058362 TaxID=3346458 RepID=UPI0036593AE8